LSCVKAKLCKKNLHKKRPACTHVFKLDDPHTVYSIAVGTYEALDIVIKM